MRVLQAEMNQRAPISFRRWIRLARASYFVAVDVNVSIELGVVSRLASLRARCAFSRHDHSMSCRSSTVKWHGTSLGFADEVGIYPVCQILASPTSTLKRKAARRLSPSFTCSERDAADLERARNELVPRAFRWEVERRHSGLAVHLWSPGNQRSTQLHEVSGDDCCRLTADRRGLDRQRDFYGHLIPYDRSSAIL